MKENQLKGIMTELLETKGRKSAFQIFLESEKIDMNLLRGDSEIPLTRSSMFSNYLLFRNEYKNIIKDEAVRELFERMRLLETKMIQTRCMIDTVVKLGMINQKRGGSETSYIIARAPFYNPDNVKAEIRVYLGKTEEIGRSLEELSRDPKFMDDAEKQIVRAMKEVMDKVSVPTKVAVKKSVMVEQSVSTGSENELEMESKNVIKKKRMDSPYRPKNVVNPAPSSGFGLILPKK
jgi:hypothetical protein